MISHYKKDYERYKKTKFTSFCYIKSLFSDALRYVMLGRLSVRGGVLRIVYKRIGQRMGNEIDFSHIGEGIVLKHPYCITVNPNAVLGKNITLFKGCTIGAIRGEGVPRIGDNVVICCNAMVCGNITVGNDVLIAAGAFVNFDVPDHSVVIGNPGIIHYKIGAADKY